MHILEELDKGVGSNPQTQPMFDVDNLAKPTAQNEGILTEVRAGVFNKLFEGKPSVSEIANQALVPLPQPSVALLASAPDAPIKIILPNYPPIGRAAHVEGDVSVSFVVSKEGTGKDISFTSGPKLRMLEGAVSDTIAKWRFAPGAVGHAEAASFRFQMNCSAQPKS